MIPVAVLVAGLFAASVIPAEAKRARSLPGTKPAQTSSPSAATATKPSTPAPTSTRPTVVFFSTGGATAASAQDAAKRQEALGHGAWSGASSPPALAKPIMPASIPNLDARELPILGRGGGDLRPVKGFEAIN